MEQKKIHNRGGFSLVFFWGGCFVPSPTFAWRRDHKNWLGVSRAGMAVTCKPFSWLNFLGWGWGRRGLNWGINVMLGQQERDAPVLTVVLASTWCHSFVLQLWK